MINPTSKLGGQFKGFVNLPAVSEEARPARQAPASEGNHEDHIAAIKAELANHPKKTPYGMFVAGLQSMGVANNKQNMGHIAGLIGGSSEQFHALVKLARKNAIGQKQNIAQTNNQKKKNGR